MKFIKLTRAGLGLPIELKVKQITAFGLNCDGTTLVAYRNGAYMHVDVTETPEQIKELIQQAKKRKGLKVANTDTCKYAHFPGASPNDPELAVYFCTCSGCSYMWLPTTCPTCNREVELAL